ncbi:MAG: lauroyl acyltransferase [Inquilinus sp.]|nr:lauroyl acyltransferase [Inquilinus sp.]
MANKSPARRRLDRWLFYPLQTVLLYGFYGLFALLPLDAASALGGFIGTVVGPRLGPANRRAFHNVSLAFPEKDEVECRAILRGMWENVGRTFGEYPHLGRIRDGGRIETVGVEENVRRDAADRPRIFIGAHVGNWELPGIWTAKHIGRMTFIYRAPNNRSADRLICRIRQRAGMAMARKGAEGTKAALKALSQGDNLGMLLDQKLNRGVAVPFFGREAMTTPALALFVQRYECPVIPVQVERLRGAHFRITYHAPLELPRTGDRHADIHAAMTLINQVYEDWIRRRPEQWFWMHRRWIDSIG